MKLKPTKHIVVNYNFTKGFSGDNILTLTLTQPGSGAMMEDIELSLKLAKIIFFSIMLQTIFFNKPIK